MVKFKTFENDILLHYLNLEYRKVVGLDAFQSIKATTSILHNLNYAGLLLCKDYCLMPYSTLIEDNIISNLFIKKSYNIFFEKGYFRVSLREDTPEEFLDKKIKQYDSHPKLYGYFKGNALQKLKEHKVTIEKRPFEVGKEIYDNWKNGLENHTSRSIWEPVIKGNFKDPLIMTLSEIPDRILNDNKGIIWPLVNDLLESKSDSQKMQIRQVLHHLYFSSYLKFYDMVIITGLPFTHNTLGLDYYKGINYNFSFFSFVMTTIGIKEEVFSLSSDELIILKESNEFSVFLDFYHAVFGNIEAFSEARKILNTILSEAKFKKRPKQSINSSNLIFIISAFDKLMEKINIGDFIKFDINNGIYMFDKFRPPSIKEFIDRLIKACIKLQGNRVYRGNYSEDDRNTFISNLLENDDFNTKDQTRWSKSHVGKSAGEIDIFILDKRNFPYAIVEALNLASLKTDYILLHIDKIFNYDTTGLEYNVILNYSSAKNFDILWSNYVTLITNHTYKYKFIEFEMVNEYTYTDIKIGKAMHLRNGQKIFLYHLMVNLHD
jgi:hypothetical protein